MAGEVVLGDKDYDVDAIFSSLDRAIGKLVREWATLHDDLGKLFAATMGMYPETMPVKLAAWQSQVNDRAQREMLRASALSLLEWGPNEMKPALEEVDWLLSRCESVAEGRNNIVHASYTLSWLPAGPEIASNDFFGNKRAKKLVGKDLIDVTTKCSSNCRSLYMFCRNLTNSLVAGMALPARPKLI